jgi:hypothetical protein
MAEDGPLALVKKSAELVGFDLKSRAKAAQG